ncbi:MAG: sulfotransferase [Halieaceae bacterium]
MDTRDKPPLLILGAPPRGGNHLLRGLLDNHPQLLLPPDEDYFVRHLSRSVLTRWRGMLCSSSGAPGFYRQLQKEGHLERINAGHGTEVFGSENSLDLEAYYGYIRTHHERGNLDSLVRNHIEALALALGKRHGDKRLRVFFCALQPSNTDLTEVGRLLSHSYSVRGIFLVRDPRAHLSSKLVRNPTLNLRRFCQRQNRYWRETEWFEQHCGPLLRLRFEDLVTDTEARMRAVCDFASIEYTDKVLEYTQGGQPSISNSSFGGSSGIDRSALTRYRNTLPASTIAYLEQHCQPQLFWQGPITRQPADAGAPVTPYNP